MVLIAFAIGKLRSKQYRMLSYTLHSFSEINDVMTTKQLEIYKHLP